VVKTGFCKKDSGQANEHQRHLNKKLISELPDIGCPRNKQKKIFGSNQNKLKQDLFWLCFGLFCETKNNKFRFVSVSRTNIEKTETNKTVSKQTDTTLNSLKNT
jgi:hypothetical protein